MGSKDCLSAETNKNIYMFVEVIIKRTHIKECGETFVTAFPLRKIDRQVGCKLSFMVQDTSSVLCWIEVRR